jgi:hypothetical protein
MTRGRVTLREVADLVDALDRHEVVYPDPVAAAMRLHAAIVDGTVQALARRSHPVDLVTLSVEELAAHTRSLAVTRALEETEQVQTVAVHVDEDLCAQVVALLREHADDIVDQLRPRFDPAAAYLHQAVAVGITAGMTAQQVISLGDRAVNTWRTLPRHVRVLDEIAAVRIAMSEVLDVAPDPRPFSSPPARRYGAAFSTSAPPWRIDRAETSTARWLRLSTGEPEPLRLLTLEETARTAQRTEPPIEPIIQEVDGRLQDVRG